MVRAICRPRLEFVWPEARDPAGERPPALDARPEVRGGEWLPVPDAWPEACGASGEGGVSPGKATPTTAALFKTMIKEEKERTWGMKQYNSRTT